MALPELLQTLRAQAAERREAALSRAREACEHIRETSTGGLARRRAEHLARVEREEVDASRRLLSLAQADAATAVLQARGELLDRVREGVSERIGEGDLDPEHRASALVDLREALGRLPPGPVLVTAPAALAGDLEGALMDGERVRIETSDGLRSGFLARAGDGSAEVDATLEAALERLWPRLAVRVLAELGP